MKYKVFSSLTCTDAESETSTEVQIAEDQLYAQVETTTNSQPSPTNPHLADMKSFENPLYAQVDIVEKQEGEAEVCPEEAEAVYSVARGTKSQILQEELDSHGE